MRPTHVRAVAAGDPNARAASGTVAHALFVGVMAAWMLFTATTSVARSGVADPTFGDGGYVKLRVSDGWDTVSAVYPLTNGGVLVVGRCSEQSCIARLLASGEPDIGFSPDGWTTLPPLFAGTFSIPRSMALSDGGYLVAMDCFGVGDLAATRGICSFRLNADGTRDMSFAGSGMLLTQFSSQALIALQERDGGALAIIARCNDVQGAPPVDFCIAQYSPTGAVDTAFGNSGRRLVALGYFASDARIDSAGRIVAASKCPDANSHDSNCVARHFANGVADPSFFGGQRFHLQGLSETSYEPMLRIDGAGRILVAATCQPLSVDHFCITRILESGMLDSAFGSDGFALIPLAATSSSSRGETLNDIGVLPDGRLLLVGACSRVGDAYVPSFCAKRLLPSSVPDSTFGESGHFASPPNGKYYQATAISRMSNDKVLLGGKCGIDGHNDYDYCVVRLRGGPYNVATCGLNIDANVAVDSGTDALLSLRYLLGVRGSALSSNATGASPGRTNAEIETYLADLLAHGKLDADGDGQSLAMTDGLLILRAMLGLTGDALTAGAVNTAHPNARNAQQILSWIEATHGVACLP